MCGQACVYRHIVRCVFTTIFINHKYSCSGVFNFIIIYFYYFLLVCSIRVSISELIKLTYSLRLSRKKEQVSARKRNAHRASKQNKITEKETSCKKEQVNARKHSAHQASQSQKKTRWERKVMSIVALAATYNLHQVLPLRAILGELLQMRCLNNSMKRGEGRNVTSYD